jgi:hypothetical protein
MKTTKSQVTEKPAIAQVRMGAMTPSFPPAPVSKDYKKGQ